MLFMFGIRHARIGHYTDEEHVCYRCRAFDREVSIYRPYFHFCFIPVCPVGPAWFAMHCRNCNDDTRLETVMKANAHRTRAPFYFYSFIILVVCVALGWFYWKNAKDRQNKAYVTAPLVGDVYNIKEKTRAEETYSFLRVVVLKEDTVLLLSSHYEYGGFVSSLGMEDYFEKSDTIRISRQKLQDMLGEGRLYDVYRHYSESRGFNRIQ